MKYLNYYLLCSLSIGMLFVTSCGDDEEPMTGGGDAPVSSFQFEVDADDFLKVTFSNFSQNADSQVWDFGDGGMSTEKDPVYTYAEAGTYTVVLTSTNTEGSHPTQKDVTLTNPNDAAEDLTGGSSKVWKLSRNVAEMEFPAQVGPADKSQIWWAFGQSEELGTRSCFMEDEYIFGADGSFTYKSNGSVWAEAGVWNADVEATCIDDSDASLMTGPNGEDLSAWGSGEFTFDFDPSAATLTVNGLGAHLGIAKVGTDAEYLVPQSSVTYKVTKLETDGPVDKLFLETTLPNPGYWQFILVSYDNPADEPELADPSAEAAFWHEIDGSNVQFNNTSGSADSYVWDFGDGQTSTEESPSYTYANDGFYTVTLTATNAFGSSDATANVIISANSTFSANVIDGGDAKTWKLNPFAGALGVGPTKGSGEWFATSADDVNDRSCTFDDTYTFATDGSFNYETNGDLWAEAYMGVTDAACINESDLSADAAAWGSGMHSFSVMEGAGADPSFLSVMGTGAFIGLPKAFNGGEYAAGPPTSDGTVRYEVVNYADAGSYEILVIAVDISADGSLFWTYVLRAE